MANLGMHFNAEEAPTGGDFSPMPPGNYQAQIINSEMRSAPLPSQEQHNVSEVHQ